MLRYFLFEKKIRVKPSNFIYKITDNDQIYSTKEDRKRNEKENLDMTLFICSYI
jgi:hypothetical protein